MADYDFERDCRTPFSEAYNVLDGEHPVGRVDLHFTPTVVQATLCVLESITEEGIQELIETIDEQLVDSQGIPREDFIVHVYQGRETGVYSDNVFPEHGNGAGGVQ